MKIAILGDTHFGMRNDNPVFQELHGRFYEQVFFPYLESNNIRTVIQLGDLFDRRKYVNFNSLSHARRVFFDVLQDRNIEFYTLIGNHDIYYKDTLELNSPELLVDHYDVVNIIKEPTSVNFAGLEIDFIPWICDQNETEVVDFIRESTSEFCCGHFELSGFEMDRGNYCTDGWDASHLRRYEVVFSGHFHHKSIQNNILYVGSPGEMTWADCDDPRGFHVFDTETREIEFIQNPYTIFKKIVYNDENFFYEDLKNHDFTQYTNKFCKIYVVRRSNAFLFESFIDSLVKSNPLELTLAEDFTETASANTDHQVDQTDDTATILDKYVDSMEIEIDKSKMKSVVREVYLEAMSTA